jgi:hypothetical protein
MGFAKLDEGIVYSSLLLEDDYVFKVFILLIATCRSDGISPLTDIFIASVTRKSIENVREAIKILSSRDENSRIKCEGCDSFNLKVKSGMSGTCPGQFETMCDNCDKLGQRVRKVDEGYYVINHSFYRGKDYKEYNRDRKRVLRDSYKNQEDTSEADKCPGQIGTSVGHYASASASEYASDKGKRDTKGERKTPNWLATYWNSKSNIPKIRIFSDTVLNAEKRMIRDYGEDELKACVDNFDYVMGSPDNYFGKYPHSFADFFRNGSRKAPPFEKFLPDRNPLEVLKEKDSRSKKINSDNLTKRLEKEGKSEYRDVDKELSKDSGSLSNW